jgi:predicted membrane protein
MENNHYNFDGKDHKHGSEIFRPKSLIFGLLVIVAGLLLMAKNTGFITPEVSHIVFSWEMLLIAIGLANLFSYRSVVSGVILILIGGFFLLVDFYNLPFGFWNILWPVLIILVGLSMIFGMSRWRRHHGWKNSGTSNENFFEDIAVFGGGERKIVSTSLEGGKMVAIFGGSKIDLSRCTLAPGQPMIELVAIFGGTTLTVPPEWNVKVEVFNIFGGYADKRVMNQIDPSKTLVLKGVTIFGGGEIRSY